MNFLWEKGMNIQTCLQILIVELEIMLWLTPNKPKYSVVLATMFFSDIDIFVTKEF